MVTAADILAARILIVDDQESNVLLLEQMLGDAGYSCVTSTTDPHEVCELHRKHHYDLILLDLQMPGMDGFQVMEGLKAIEKDSYLPVLVITAQPSHKLRALQAGAKDFISKPFDVIEVRTRIRNMLEVRLLHKKIENDNLALEQAVRERTAELRASEARFRSLTELSSDWYWEQDESGRFTNVSGPVLEMLGLGLDASAIDAESAPAEAWNEAERAKLAENIALRRPFLDFEYSRIKPDGSRRYLQVSGEPIFDGSGRFTGYRGIGTDVTERMRAEEDVRGFRLTMDTIPDALLLVARTGMRFIDVNDTACRMFGFGREEFLKLGPEAVGKGSREELESRYDSLIAGDTGSGISRLQLRRKDGSQFPAEVQRRAQHSDKGWILVLFIRDIGQRNEATHRSSTGLDANLSI
jgi:PAS domain S-box-containing protein